ncbi:hypothetical protein BVX98_06505 [bacterium F11]|nr:hypothetical protein BVX98_06505 [bacterium F11]
MKGNNLVTERVQNLPRGTDFADRIDSAIHRSRETGRPFFVILLQIENIEAFSKRKPRYVVLNLYKELFQILRKAVHQSQFVGTFQDGFGFVFDAVDVGQVDFIGKKITALATQVIRGGHYNDLSSRWSEIIAQFLTPGKPSVIYPRIGWAIYPRDGENATQVVKRALCHVDELNR